MAKYETDTNGFVTIPDNPISKSGVFQYSGRAIDPSLESDKLYNVWRPEEELNNPETIESFKLAPWIPRHEMIGESYTAAESVGVQGTIGEQVYYKGKTLFANLRLFGESLKSAIKNGLQELSCGFSCTWDVKSGVTPDGKQYDAIQRNIRGNHIASVDQGRMGSEVSVALDSFTFALDNLEVVNDTETEVKMTLEDMNKQFIAMDESDKEKFKEMIKEKAKDKEEKDTAKDKEEETKDEYKEEAKDKEEDKDKEKSKSAMDALEAKLATLEAKLEEANSNAMDSLQIEKQIAEKTDLYNKVTPLIGQFDHTGKSINDVAQYANEKLGIACDSGEEVAALKGYLHAQQPVHTTVVGGSAQDGSEVSVPDSLKSMGF